MDYKDSGVDIHAGYKSVELMRSHIARTMIKGVCGDVGGFGGLFELDLSGINNPVLVSGTDGVGTKLKLAFSLDKHDTIGIDCVAMCVNDIICSGAKPLFFLDYIACGKNIPTKIEQIVKGVCDGCIQAGAALIGGETAEMPGFYPIDEYDLAGYCTGIVDKNAIIDNSKISEGDVIIALASSGVHSNGFSLVRKVFDLEKDKALAEELLIPTKIYVKPILALLREINIKGISHITGGGFYENIPRMLPEKICAQIERKNIKVLPIFDRLAKDGKIEEYDMFNTFNMGVGMAVVVDKSDVDKAISILTSFGEDAYVIGSTIQSDNKIIIK
ncbi:MAG: phosphoribosylformylglycinamidine cyclo-ligase [Eubacteriales bacterium]